MKCEDMPEYLMSYATKITETVRGSAQIHLRKNSFQCWVTEKDLCPLNGQSASKSLPTKPSLFHLLQPVYNSTFTEQQQRIFQFWRHIWVNFNTLRLSITCCSLLKIYSTRLFHQDHIFPYEGKKKESASILLSPFHWNTTSVEKS